MSGADMNETLKIAIERWGFPALVAIAIGWVLRTDVLLPLVKQHSEFLHTVSSSQKEIAEAVKEQTKILYAIKPELREHARTVKVEVPE